MALSTILKFFLRETILKFSNRLNYILYVCVECDLSNRFGVLARGRVADSSFLNVWWIDQNFVGIIEETTRQALCLYLSYSHARRISTVITSCPTSFIYCAY